MKRMTIQAIAISAAILSSAFPQLAHSESLTVGGTGAATELMKELGKIYAKRAPVEFSVIPSLGSTGALSALADGVLDVAVSARSPKPDEVAKGLNVSSTFRTPFVLATSHRKPDGMKSTDVQAAFVSSATWSDGSPLSVILRPKSESDTTLFGDLFPGMAAAIAAARNRPDVPVGATDQDNADLAEKTPGSLIGASYTQIMLEKRNLRFVAIDGVLPALDTFEKGTYKYSKPLYVVVGKDQKKHVVQFIEWLKSPDGAKQLRALHVVKGG